MMTIGLILNALGTWEVLRIMTYIFVISKQWICSFC